VRLSTRRKSIVFFIAFGTTLTAIAVALNVGWILLNWRQVALMILGIVFFAAIITGLVLNTVFLVREIRRNEQHDSFIDAVTHELKTPIASIRLYLETLQSRDVPYERRREFVGVMLADTDRLLRTVEQVLSAGRVGQRRRPIDLEIVDMGEIARHCVDDARAQLLADGASLTYREALANGRRPTVTGDADELRSAVANLVDNAIKYSGDRIEVEVAVAMDTADMVTVRVSDRGIGIPRSELRRIFRRFYRIPTRMFRHVKGSGLGLFIVGSVVRCHGGRAYAESRGEGLGSVFTLELPAAERT
jgi:signal transduction histidine kinase